VEADFYDKGPSKYQIVVQHSKLKDGRKAEQMKAYWSGKIEGLKEFIEG
jgi:hypothetical protein